MEETLVDDATAARSINELEAEIVILKGLEAQAKIVVASGQDRKWDELSKILQNAPEMRDVSNRQRKLIIFSEHRDTLNYLHEKIAGVIGNHEAVVTIHGGILYSTTQDFVITWTSQALRESTANLWELKPLLEYQFKFDPHSLNQTS